MRLKTTDKALIAAFAAAFVMGAMIHTAYRMGQQNGSAQTAAIFMRGAL